MLKLKKIAITGGIASGKSTVGRFFQKLGAYVVDSDEIVHKLLSPETVLGQQIIKLLGPEIVENGRFNRKIIAEKVFKDHTKLQALEQLIHPSVLNDIESVYQKIEKQNKYHLFVVEVPLLFEIGADKFFDYVIAVIADPEQCKQRLKENKISPDEYTSRMQRQISPEIKAKKAHTVLHNNGTLQELQEKVETLFKQLSA